MCVCSTVCARTSVNSFIIPRLGTARAGGFYVKVFVIHSPPPLFFSPQLRIAMGQCELQAHSVTVNRGGEGGDLISDTKMYTAAAVAAVAEERGWARRTQLPARPVP